LEKDHLEHRNTIGRKLRYRCRGIILVDGSGAETKEYYWKKDWVQNQRNDILRRIRCLNRGMVLGEG
jgi:hypothetical protein